MNDTLSPQLPSTSATMHPSNTLVEERVRALQVLTAAVLGGIDTLVLAGPEGKGWSYSPSSRVIRADTEDLKTRSSEFCQGLVLHELGHAAITRYHEVVPKEWMAKQLLPCLLNVVEDGRLERWVARVLPGSAEWIAYANRELVHDVDAEATPVSLSGDFLRGLLYLQYFGNVVTTNPVVQDALVQAAPSLARILDCLPITGSMEQVWVDQAYVRHAAAQVWMHKDTLTRPSSFERSVRMTQVEMWGEVYAHLWPILESLIEQDKKAENPKDQWLEKLLKSFALRGNLGDAKRPMTDTMGGMRTQSSVEKKLFPGSGKTWDRLRQGQAQAIDTLSKHLLEIFSRWGRKELSSGHVSGIRPDLRAVVRAQADPRAWDQVWMRQKIPHRADPCFVLLLDSSGSMERANKAKLALEGVVVVAEACRTAGIPLEVWSFANSLDSILLHQEPLGSLQRKRIEGYPNTCGGGTDLALALQKLTTHVQALPWRDRILLVLSDGKVKEHLPVRNALQNLRTNGVVCLGLGVGPETKHLSDFFPGDPCGIDPAEIGSEMCRVLSQAATQLK